MVQGQTTESREATTGAAKPNGNLNRYVWITLGFTVLSQGGVVALQALFIPSEVRAPRQSLSEMPLLMGYWTGHGAEVDKEIFASVGADELINRSYANSTGSVVTVHCATWMSAGVSMPHPPELCYSSNGWALLESRAVTLPDRPRVRISVQRYGRAEQRVVVVYWYQMDDRTYLDRNGERIARKAMWGKRQWPPLTKTLLQTSESEKAESLLLDIAAHIYDFNCKR